MRSILAAAEPNMSVIILITGFVVVFAVLFLLIGIIKLYSMIVSSAQNKSAKKAAQKAAEKEERSAPVQTAAPMQPADVSDGALDPQTVAVITAAVEAFYSGDKKVRVTGIRRASGVRTEWAAAGIAENISSMRAEGIL